MAGEMLQAKKLHFDMEKTPVIMNPYVACSVVVAYVSFTKVIGPSMMKNRKPMELQWLMILFNAALIVSNVFLSASLSKLVYVLWPYRCDFLNSPEMERKEEYIILCIVGFYIKFAELFDTVLFILRKKYNQVSFLHVFHHAAVFILVWSCLKNNFIKFHFILAAAVNCGVHVVLYSYYALAALGPNVRKHLWWKKYLTKLQIMQFFVLMFYMLISFFTGCESFENFEKVSFSCLLIITVLFFNFYFHAYRKHK